MYWLFVYASKYIFSYLEGNRKQVKVLHVKLIYIIYIKY